MSVTSENLCNLLLLICWARNTGEHSFSHFRSYVRHENVKPLYLIFHSYSALPHVIMLLTNCTQAGPTFLISTICQILEFFDKFPYRLAKILHFFDGDMVTTRFWSLFSELHFFSPFGLWCLFLLMHWLFGHNLDFFYVWDLSVEFPCCLRVSHA